MKTDTRLAASVLALSGSSPAFADPDGLLTLVVGVPLQLVAAVVLGVLLTMRRRRRARLVAVLLFVPTLAYSLYVALDAVTLLKDIGSENSMIALAFFGLLAVVCLLFVLTVRRPPAD